MIGIGNIEELLRWSVRNTPIEHYTLYGLSMENLQRPAAQLKALGMLYAKHFKRLAEDEVIHEQKVHVDIIGREDMLPEEMVKAVNIAREATEEYDSKYLWIALAYSGRQEIIDSVKRLSGAGKELTVENVSANLYVNAPEPDLIIRTAEKRVSNFLLWQGAYAELYFSEKYWPDFKIEDYEKALEDYSERKRRFGK